MPSKYTEIAGRLRRDIQAGVYADRLPSERKLAVAFGSTAMTVRKALAILAGEGLVRKEPPLGTFVERRGRPRLRVSLLPSMLEAPLTEALRQSFREAFPDVEVTLDASSDNPERYGDFDLLRSANLSPVPYHDFALPYPPALVARFDPERYYGAAFDVHRINGSLYALPLVFSPVVFSADRDLLAAAGVPADPYGLNLDALLTLNEFAGRRKLCLWDTPALRTVLRSLVYSAGDASNSLERVDPARLRNLLRRFKPLLAAGTVLTGADDPARCRALLRFGCRQAMRRVDPGRTAILAMPRELRAKTCVAGEFLLLNGRGPQPALAAEVAAHFLSPGVQGLFSRHQFGLPVLKSAAVDSLDTRAWRDDVFFNEVRNLCANSAAEYGFLQRLYSFVDDLVAGRMDADRLARCLDYEIEMARKKTLVRARLASEDAPEAAPAFRRASGS